MSVWSATESFSFLHHWLIDKLPEWLTISVHYEKVFLAAAKYPVNIHLALLDTNHGACPSVHRVVFYPASVTEHNDDFLR